MLKNLKKKVLKKIRRPKRIRSVNELFATGQIFTAKDKELDNIIKEYTSKASEINNKDVFRALTVLVLKNNRHSDSTQYLNIFLSIVVIFLTLFSLKLAIEQTNYTELSTRSDRIEQNILIRNALEYCKQNSDAVDSGLRGTESGKTASCSEVINNRNLDKYRD